MPCAVIEERPRPDAGGPLLVTLTIVGLTTLVAVLLCAAPRQAEAQTGRTVRIGYLSAGTVETRNPRLVAFRQRLRELGYVEGQNVAFEIRSPADGGARRLPDLAAELARLKVDVIVAAGTASVGAAQKASTSIPIVMVGAGDPVPSGFAASLARPGGNITGLTIQTPDTVGKLLQLLKEAVPHLTRLTVLWDPGLPRRTLSETEAAASALGLALQVVHVRSSDELDGAFAAAARSRVGAVYVTGVIASLHRARIAELALKHQLPTVGSSPELGDAGWLMGYGPSLIDQHRRAADFVDRILKGAKPADLPVEQPTKFYLAINLKTAKALGLRIPQPLLVRADQVIEQ